MNEKWKDKLPKPVAFVLSGGANLGSVQVGMLKALYNAGIEPDMVAGTSVGALNGAAIANHGLASAVDRLTEVWLNLQRKDIFPGTIFSQVRSLLSTRLHLYSHDRLAELICSTLNVGVFEELILPFGVMATELETHKGTLFMQGDLESALLASTALPGIYPIIHIDKAQYVDGGIAEVVPMRAAIEMGAASLVVLDVGNVCKPAKPPRHIAELVMSTFHIATRQRVFLDAPQVAQLRPTLYLPTPCTMNGDMLDFSRSAILMDEAENLATYFLQEAPVPQCGAMSGEPHRHDTKRV